LEHLNRELYTVLGVLSVAAGLFASNRVRSDLVAVMVLLALMLSGILTVNESLAGFSQPVVLIIAAMFIVGEALVETGITHSMSAFVVRASRGSETRLLILIMLLINTIGAFMSSTAIVTLFIPVVLAIARDAELNRKRLLMPVAFASLISGMMTLIATAPNLIVNDALKTNGLAPLAFFSFTPFGVATLLAGICYMLICGRQMLSGETHAKAGPQRLTLEDLAASYGIQDRLVRLRLLPGSPLLGKTVGSSRIHERYGINLTGFERWKHGKRMFLPAHPDTIFEPGDMIFILLDSEPLDNLLAAEQLAVVRPLRERGRREAAQGLGLAEVILPPRSHLIGRTLKEAEFRSRYSVTVLAVRRGGKPVTSGTMELRMDFGDVLLVSGSWLEILRLRSEQENFVLLTLPDDFGAVAPARKKVPMALGILTAMVIAMASGEVPVVAAAMVAAVALIVSGCVRLDAIYHVVNWQAVVLIGGILPLATALGKTGATEIVAGGLVGTMGHMGPLAMVSAVFLVTSLAALVISNSATAILFAPIAIKVAQATGVPPQAFAMTVAIACSAGYATPVSSPVNTLVMDPGGYSFKDFIKVGMPLQLLTLLVTALLIWLIYLR
jgi:di/tricarboxylate transporter